MSETKDLSKPGVKAALEKLLRESIDRYCVEAYDDGHRNHLGCSIIGHECSRYAWYIFRWVKKEEFSGRVHRLFNRGHKEEDRFIEWLEGIGCKVWADDLTNYKLYYNTLDGKHHLKPTDWENSYEAWLDVTNERTNIKIAKIEGIKFPQYRISGVHGHFGGSLDGIVKLPPEWGIEEPLLLEFKTSGTGAAFNNTVKQGMKVKNQQHYGQTSTYGMKYNLQYVLYMMINKNDDDIHLEVTKLDHNLGKQMEMKAEKIITSQEPPPKVSQSKTYLKCKWCNFSDICHENGIAEKNCRSCQHAVPAEQGEWICTLNNGVIPKDFIPEGCDSHKSITVCE